MLQLNIILLILSLLIYTTIFTLYIEVNYISVVTTQIKTFPQQRGNKALPTFGVGTLSSKKL